MVSLTGPNLLFHQHCMPNSNILPGAPARRASGRQPRRSSNSVRDTHGGVAPRHPAVLSCCGRTCQSDRLSGRSTVGAAEEEGFLPWLEQDSPLHGFMGETSRICHYRMSKRQMPFDSEVRSANLPPCSFQVCLDAHQESPGEVARATARPMKNPPGAGRSQDPDSGFTLSSLPLRVPRQAHERAADYAMKPCYDRQA